MNNGTILTGTGLTKKYGDLAVVKEVSLSLAAGEFVCLVGKSGCGKTTLLSMLSGLERPTELFSVIGIVNRISRIRPQIENLMPGSAHGI